MEIKRFVGRDVRTALRLVRESLGPDAMILSNTRTADGVEVVAAPAEMVASLSKGPPGVLRDLGKDRAARPPSTPVATGRPSAASRHVPDIHAARQSVPPPAQNTDTLDVERMLREPPTSIDPGALNAMQAELSTLRSLLEKQLANGPSAIARLRPQGDEILSQLRELGLSTRFAAELSNSTALLADRDHALDEALNSLRQRLLTAGDLVNAGGCFAFVGPTGAGKTTTLCKLAVRQALAHGVDKLALVSMDRYRIGAGETLAAIGRLLGQSIVTLNDPQELGDALDGLADRRLVLIDTAGLSQRDITRQAQLSALAEQRWRVHSLLVMPASSQARHLEQTVCRYTEAMPLASVISRLDETASLGEVLEILVAASLPVAYTTDGTEIPDDIAVADTEELLRTMQLLGRADTPAGDGRVRASGSWPQERYNAGDRLAARAAL